MDQAPIVSRARQSSGLGNGSGHRHELRARRYFAMAVPDSLLLLEFPNPSIKVDTFSSLAIRVVRAGGDSDLRAEGKRY